jgi:AcrR family transcriptional regulator
MARGDSPPELVRSTALALFARQGMAATSLQMIADELGVTKAAVYHHYRTKAEIADAVLEPALAAVAELVEHAEQIDDVAERQDLIIRTLAQQAVEHHQMYAVMLRELPISRLMQGTRNIGMFVRLQRLLEGGDESTATLSRSGIFLTGLMAPTTDPRLAEVDDAELERALIAAGRALIRLPSNAPN